MMISMKFPPKNFHRLLLDKFFYLIADDGNHVIAVYLICCLPWEEYFFLNIFPQSVARQAMTRGRISANDSAMILGDGMRVRNHRWAPAVKP